MLSLVKPWALRAMFLSQILDQAGGSERFGVLSFESQELGLEDRCLVHPLLPPFHRHLSWSPMLKFTQLKLRVLPLALLDLFIDHAGTLHS